MNFLSKSFIWLNYIHGEIQLVHIDTILQVFAKCDNYVTILAARLVRYGTDPCEFLISVKLYNQ